MPYRLRVCHELSFGDVLAVADYFAETLESMAANSKGAGCTAYTPCVVLLILRLFSRAAHLDVCWHWQ